MYNINSVQIIFLIITFLKKSYAETEEIFMNYRCGVFCLWFALFAFASQIIFTYVCLFEYHCHYFSYHLDCVHIATLFLISLLHTVGLFSHHSFHKKEGQI